MFVFVVVCVDIGIEVDDCGYFDFFFVCCVVSVLVGVGVGGVVGVDVGVGVNTGVNAVPKNDLPRDRIRHGQFKPLFLILIPQRPHHNLVLCDICALYILLFAFSFAVVVLSLFLPRTSIITAVLIAILGGGIRVDAVFGSIPMQLTSIIRSRTGVGAKRGVESGGYVGCGSVAVALSAFFGG